MLRTSLVELPTALNVEDDSLPIAYDFRTWIKVDLIMKDHDIPDEAKLPLICQYIGVDLFHFSGSAEDLWASIFNFYICDTPMKSSEGMTKSKDIAYRFDCEWWLIFAAFQQQYGLNLLTAKLHWFEFRALLDGLTETTEFIKVVQARLRDTSKLKGEERTQAEKLKRYWKVPDGNAEVEERDPHEIEAELLARIKD